MHKLWRKKEKLSQSKKPEKPNNKDLRNRQLNRQPKKSKESFRNKRLFSKQKNSNHNHNSQNLRRNNLKTKLNLLQSKKNKNLLKDQQRISNNWSEMKFWKWSHNWKKKCLGKTWMKKKSRNKIKLSMLSAKDVLEFCLFHATMTTLRKFIFAELAKRKMKGQTLWSRSEASRFWANA